jgi:hypothetical protein
MKNTLGSIFTQMEKKFEVANKELMAFYLFALFWSLLLGGSGTLTSGFHFTDDHEIISINKLKQKKGVFYTTKRYIQDDLKIRFRPFYYFYKIVLSPFLGAHFLLWSLLNLILAIVSSWLLFLFAYRLGYHIIPSTLFPFLTLIGSQAAIWWRLGTNELMGFFLLSLSLFYLANGTSRRKSYQIALSITFLFLSSLSKESFILIIPAYVLMFIWFKHQKNRIGLIQTIYASFISITILLLLFIIEISTILFWVGTNKMGYAGVDNSLNLPGVLKFIYAHLRESQYLILICFGTFLLLQPAGSFFWRRNSILRYGYNMSILAAIIFPQFILYYKSGLFERYLLPLNLGFSFFILFLLNQIFETKTITFFSKYSYVLLIAVVLFSVFKRDTWSNARAFAREGKTTNNFLSSIVNNTDSKDSILIILNAYQDYEWGYAAKVYLADAANRKNILYYPVHKHENNAFAKLLDAGFTENNKDIIAPNISLNYKCIAILPFDSNQVIIDRLDSNCFYTKYNSNKFNTYIKKTSASNSSKAL